MRRMIVRLSSLVIWSATVRVSSARKRQCSGSQNRTFWMGIAKTSVKSCHRFSHRRFNRAEQANKLHIFMVGWTTKRTASTRGATVFGHGIRQCTHYHSALSLIDHDPVFVGNRHNPDLPTQQQCGWQVSMRNPQMRDAERYWARVLQVRMFSRSSAPSPPTKQTAPPSHYFFLL